MFLSLTALFLWNCTDTIGSDFYDDRDAHDDFTIDEAKAFFEKQYSKNIPLSRSIEEKGTKRLTPGDFVPLWDVAVPLVMNGLACYDIPISETYSYQVIFPEEHYGTIIASKVKVYQKLVILKDLKDNRMSQYVLSLIPVKSYELQKGEQIPELFTTHGDKGGFSGIAIYSCLYTGVTARVDTYRNGRKVNGVFLLDAKDQEELNSKIETAKEQIYMLSLQKKKKILSRGESDYGYDIDGGWLDDVIITPEEPWDGVGADGMTNEEWAENTRPDGSVDPQPEPDEVEHEEDDYIPEEEPEEKNEPSISGFNIEEEAKVKAAIDNLHVRLPNIDLRNVKIEKGMGKSNAYVRPKDGTIIINNHYFQKEYNNIDRTSIFYHEIYHLQNGHYGDVRIIDFTELIMIDNMSIPQEIRNQIMENIQDEMKYLLSINPNIDKETYNTYYEMVYQQEFSISSVKEPQYYINEIETYKEEKSIFPDKQLSEEYKEDRGYAEWKNELLKTISEQYFK